MCKKLICLFFSIFMLSLTGSVYADLVGHWKLDDGSGTTVADSSGNGNDGTFVGNLQWVAGKDGGALDFDGESYVDCGNDPSLNVTGPFSGAIWIRPGTLGGPDSQALLCKATPPDWSWQLRFAWGGGGQDNIIGWQFNSPGERTWIYVGQELPVDEWYHIAASHDGETVRCYLDGVETDSAPMAGINGSSTSLQIGSDGWGFNWIGLIDDVRIYDHAISKAEVEKLTSVFIASNPKPSDGAIYSEIWARLEWQPGAFAASHDVYMGENFDDVNDGVNETFRGNQPGMMFIVGFPTYAYPDGLVPGTTYYWRIDEVNEADPNSPWKGDVWSFLVPPKTAYYPDPADGTEFVPRNTILTWAPGLGAQLHTVYIGEDFDTVNEAAGGVAMEPLSYTPGSLKLAKTYYWRVDEDDGDNTYKGDIWSFTTEGAVTNPNPADGAMDVNPTQILTWDAGAIAASHEVYFGSDSDAVKNATKASPEYKGPKALGEESYDPGILALTTTYYWRIDEINGVNPDSPWAGDVWSFTTSDFFVIDDFEDYDAWDNQIYWFWKDGLGYVAHDTEPAYSGNGTGSAVGNDTPPYIEESIVHGGSQSMPYTYNNNMLLAKYSEAELTLDAVRDWTAEGVTDLSLWFRGYPEPTGSFVEGPVGTYTMTGSGADIWGNSDEFHFAFKTLSGAGSIVAKVQSIENTWSWAKAGVMIRETLDPNSAHAMMVVTPTEGISFQRRNVAGDTTAEDTTGGISAPYWVKIDRDVAGNFIAYSSTNGSTWQMQGLPDNISMGSNVYIGLIVVSTRAALTCQAVLSNVTTTGAVGQQWAHQDIGIVSNDAEPLYVAVSNSAGTSSAMVVHDDPAATTIDTWTQWVIPLQAFTDQGFDLTNVDRIAIGLGTKGNMTIPGGSGKMYFDDIRLNRPEEAAAE